MKQQADRHLTHRWVWHLGQDHHPFPPPYLLSNKECVYHVCVYSEQLHFCIISAVCVCYTSSLREEWRRLSVSIEGPHPPVHPAVIYARSSQLARHTDVIDWMITLPLTSIRSSPAVNQRLVSPHSPAATLVIPSPRHSVNWRNAENIKQLKRDCRKAERTWGKSKLHFDWDIFKNTLRN